MTWSKRRLLVVLSLAATLVVATSLVALANVGLPYTFHITYISGFGDGVNTPVFVTNSTGKICVKPNLYVSKDADAGAQYNDNRYYIEMWRVGFGQISNKSWNADNDNVKRCWTGLNRNADHYIRIKKTAAVPGQLLAGQGVVSYT